MLCNVKFEVLTAMLLRFQVSWDVTLWHCIKWGSRHFGSITVLASSGSSSPRRKATILLGLLVPGDAGTVILRNWLVCEHSITSNSTWLLMLNDHQLYCDFVILFWLQLNCFLFRNLTCCTTVSAVPEYSFRRKSPFKMRRRWGLKQALDTT